MFKGGLVKILGILAVLAVVATAAVVFLSQSSEKHIIAAFPRAVSLYEGSDLRILGVKVGTVETVTPVGTKVIADMVYDSEYKIPADAKAALISPAIVGDRYVQMTPVYTGGPVMKDGVHLGQDRTAVPLELDQIYSSLNDLSIALGPDGVQGTNKDTGPLTRLLRTTAANFGGQGAQFNRTVTNLAKLTGTLENNKEELFGTARQMEVFIKALAENDQTVRQFNDSLASASTMLAGERQELAAALRNLGVAMTQVRGFVHDNRGLLAKNIRGLNKVAKILVKRRSSINEVLHTAPAALNNLYLAYNPREGTLDTRNNVGEALNSLTTNPAIILCGFLPSSNAAGECRKNVARIPLPRPRSAALGAEGRTTTVQHVDRSLAGLVEVDR